MPKQTLAIALCRVSSLEQVDNNSLTHQKDNVTRAAEQLGATIPRDGVWEGHVSSKEGVNFKRKDLLEMYEYCKKHTTVKYLIVQEVDRFMRSPEEQTYWYARFWYELDVQVWFADKPELNERTHVASLLRFMEGWRAAGSNGERKNKSINGQVAALKDGRYPFAPKPGYKRGRQNGIPEIHEVRGPIIKQTLISILTHRVTPTEALIELNKSDFNKGRALYKMDKFRKIVTDPFYAGIVEIDKQVKFRNENGLHEPLITKDQHEELIKIMSDKKKTQTGPRKNGNPKYPLNNIVHCEFCTEKQYSRYVGYDHSNGKNPDLIYEKYRCRACMRRITRQELHAKIEKHFSNHSISDEGLVQLMQALDTVWKQKEGQALQEATRIQHQIKSLHATVTGQVDAAIDPGNASIKEDILKSIDKNKVEIIELEQKLETISMGAEQDKDKFLTFAFGFIENMGERFLKITPENRMRCKQIIFPAGFYLDAENNVYTPEVSPLYRLAAKKKSAEALDNSLLVRVKRL